MQSHVALMIEQGAIVLGINTLEHLQMQATHVHTILYYKTHALESKFYETLHDYS